MAVLCHEFRDENRHYVDRVIAIDHKGNVVGILVVAIYKNLRQVFETVSQSKGCTAKRDMSGTIINMRDEMPSAVFKE